MAERLATVNRHFAKETSYNGGNIGPKRDDDVVIIGMARTAMTRAKRGPQATTGLESMLKPCLVAVAEQSGLPKALVEDIVIGNVLNPGSAATQARMAGFMAGYPETTCVTGINRLCSSGLQAVATIANAIRAGQISCGIGGGFESMSNAVMADQINPNLLGDDVFDCELANNCLMPMGITSENVAAEFGVDRLSQDTLAFESHMKAKAANDAGLL